MRNEADCLRLLRRTDLPRETLEELLADRVARKFHAVRRALAAHPRTPRGEALSLVRTLFWRDLAGLSADAKVHPAVRRAADLDLLRRLPEMAVAERVDLARTVGRGTLLSLRLDLDPRVLASVLDNRYTTEPDVIQATIQPRATPEALDAIAQHPRWGSRPAIRSALLRHPALPGGGRTVPSDARHPGRLEGSPRLRPRLAPPEGVRRKSPCGAAFRGLASSIPQPGS